MSRAIHPQEFSKATVDKVHRTPVESGRGLCRGLNVEWQFKRGEGGGDSSVVRAQKLVIKRSRVRIPAGTAGEFSSPGSTFCADSYFGIRSTPVLPQ